MIDNNYDIQVEVSRPKTPLLGGDGGIKGMHILRQYSPARQLRIAESVVKPGNRANRAVGAHKAEEFAKFYSQGPVSETPIVQ
jgi:hypothetical protein